jgi:hypothetical protein
MSRSWALASSVEPLELLLPAAAEERALARGDRAETESTVVPTGTRTASGEEPAEPAAAGEEPAEPAEPASLLPCSPPPAQLLLAAAAAGSTAEPSAASTS